MGKKAEGSPASEEKIALLHDNTVSPRDDRRYRGKALRAALGHERHAGWKAKDTRLNPVDILEQSNAGRVAELIPIRYGRMLASPFTFYRGSAALMAADLAKTPNIGVKVQACGDCHLLNFGAFATPERNIVFDINDFDETLPAPWEWDLKRLAVSFVLTARDNGLKPKYESQAAEAVVRAYRTHMEEFSHMSVIDIWYTRIDFQNVIERTSDPELARKQQNKLAKAVKRTGEYYMPKLTEQKDGQRVIKDNAPLIYHMDIKNREAFDAEMQNAIKRYRESLQEDKRRLFDRYKLADIAMKVVGIGSVGTVCAVALFLAPDDDPLFLQVKEARPSVLEPYAGKSQFENCGQRVVEGQRIIQAASDIFLGWTEFANGKHFYVRQLRDAKIKLDPSAWEGPQLVESAEVMGSVLAKAHARSGDAAVISGYVGEDDSFDKAVADFAVAYANQVEQDHAELVAAVGAGRIKVISEQQPE